jgi:hypothetical protein
MIVTSKNPVVEWMNLKDLQQFTRNPQIFNNREGHTPNSPVNHKMSVERTVLSALF